MYETYKKQFGGFVALIIMAVMVAGIMSAGQTVLTADFDKGFRAYQAGDYAAAIEEWHPLAEAGDTDAQFALGVMYEKGEGVKQDYAKAMTWYRRAAEADYADAQNNLGVMYRKGKGVEQNYTKAVAWYRRAAEAGDTDAQFNLRVMYDNGEGVKQDYAITYMWYNLAATQGNQQAVDNKEIATKNMTQTQIAEGQRLSRECLARNYKNCAR